MKTDVYLPLRVTGIFNMTGNVNLRYFTSLITNFLDFSFENLVISFISNKISVGVYEIWQQLVTPRFLRNLEIRGQCGHMARHPSQNY